MRSPAPGVVGAVREGFLEASLVCLRSRPRSCSMLSGSISNIAASQSTDLYLTANARDPRRKNTPDSAFIRV